MPPRYLEVGQVRERVDEPDRVARQVEPLEEAERGQGVARHLAEAVVRQPEGGEAPLEALERPVGHLGQPARGHDEAAQPEAVKQPRRQAGHVPEAEVEEGDSRGGRELPQLLGDPPEHRLFVPGHDSGGKSY